LLLKLPELGKISEEARKSKEVPLGFIECSCRHILGGLSPVKETFTIYNLHNSTTP